MSTAMVNLVALLFLGSCGCLISLLPVYHQAFVDSLGSPDQFMIRPLWVAVFIRNCSQNVKTEFLVGSTSFDRDRIRGGDSSSSSSSSSSPAMKKTSSCLFMKGNDDDEEEEETRKGIFGSGLSSSSSSSSSIGEPDDSDEEEEDDDASSPATAAVQRSGSFGCLSSLDDSLPIKRGLSSHYTGKSKSFSNLADMASSCTPAKDIVKPDNPFNKRQRLIMANKWHRKSSFYASRNPQSMPILAALVEEDEEVNGNSQIQKRQDIEEEDNEDEDEVIMMRRMPKFGASKLKGSGFKTCFSLADLQEHDDDDEFND
ncbi:hypothetical protein ACFE04_009534 [Oxalis oulophora]